jgi:hypothetical protein
MILTVNSDHFLSWMNPNHIPTPCFFFKYTFRYYQHIHAKYGNLPLPFGFVDQNGGLILSPCMLHAPPILSSILSPYNVRSITNCEALRCAIFSVFPSLSLSSRYSQQIVHTHTNMLAGRPSFDSLQR